MPSAFPLEPVLSLAWVPLSSALITILTPAVALSVLSYSMRLHAPSVVIAVAGIGNVVVHVIVKEAEKQHQRH